MMNFESHTLPNGAEVKFYPDTHVYVIDGKEVPSITQVLQLYFGDTYSAVDPVILKASSEYGTAVHQDLQEWIDLRLATPGASVVTSYNEVYNYFTYVEEIYKVEPIMTEKVVALYDKEGIPVSCGRFDLFCKVSGQETLVDFKTTSSVHRQLVTAQLNLYLKAARQSGYFDTKRSIDLGVIHLSGEEAKFVPIVRLGDSYCQKFIEKIHENC